MKNKSNPPLAQIGQMSNSDGLGGIDSTQTRHNLYAGRYETIRAMLAREDCDPTKMWGQCALIQLDMLEEIAQMRAELAELNRTYMEMMIHWEPRK